MTVSDIETLYTEAIAAFDAGDYDLAIRKAASVKLRLATTPNLTRTFAGGGSQGIVWASAQAIDSFIRDCRSLKATAQSSSSSYGPFQQTKVTYKRPDDTGDYS
jgi:hypothetical protein